ncbi:class II fructose-bisphosphate aldolase [Sodalis-like endosymbiont of Proechinophthirus fluctus]|uniref:class II fructose-bisphosphate aldolase n=1 Tax=Sodalis-like endosymbiont of Proechinophthirus fluctus TaxID=1462730 RepID=UPI00165043E8
MVPKINFDCILQIKLGTGRTMILYGSSDSGEENIRQKFSCSINKINVCTDTFVDLKEGLKNHAA